jgi:phage gp45-like
MKYSVFQSIEKLLRPIRSRLSNLIQRAIIHKSDGKQIQLSLGDKDTQDGIYQAEHFGFASIPPANADGLVLFPAGIRDVGFCISSRSQKAIPANLTEGESCQYNETGSFITLRKGGAIEIRNQNHDLIEVLSEILKILESIPKLHFIAPTGPCPMLPSDAVTLTKSTAQVRTSLNSFRRQA